METNLNKLDKLEEGDIYTAEDGVVYARLDSSKRVTTGNCKHAWYLDEPRHWQCSVCGLGKYSLIEPKS